MVLFKYLSSILIVFLMVYDGVTAYSKGSPSSSCATMTPGHGNEAQKILCPYVTLSLVRLF